VSVESLVICPDCDAVQRRVPAVRVACFRCGARLDGGARSSARGRAAACTLAAIPLFVAASALPLLRVEGPAGPAQATVLGVVAALGAQRFPALALLVLLTAVVLPAVQLGSAAYLLVVAPTGRASRATAWALRLRAAIRPWAQIEILLAGLLVVLGKLSSIFPIAPGVGLPCMVAALLLEHAARTALEPRRFWESSP